MTEPNHTIETDPAGGEAQVNWPAFPAAPDGATADRPDGDPAGDPAVGPLLDRLRDLPELPVALHTEVYSGLHDELLAALNETVAGQPAAAQAAEGRPSAGQTIRTPTTAATETGDATHEQA